jgi:hypothetical protein
VYTPFVTARKDLCPVENFLGFLEISFGSLYDGNPVLDIFRMIQAAYLAPELLDTASPEASSHALLISCLN